MRKKADREASFADLLWQARITNRLLAAGLRSQFSQMDLV